MGGATLRDGAGEKSRDEGVTRMRSGLTVRGSERMRLGALARGKLDQVCD